VVRRRHIFTEADELDLKPVQLIENFKEVVYRPGQLIERPW
jgi:hypothetical protein